MTFSLIFNSGWQAIKQPDEVEFESGPKHWGTSSLFWVQFTINGVAKITKNEGFVKETA